MNMAAPEHLRWVFAYLGRRELVEQTGMVSADKYFHNKKLRTAFNALPEISAYVPDLRAAGIRMAAELLERGATPAGRAKISEASGLPDDVVLELVHCADLCRMTGMGGRTLYRTRGLKRNGYHRGSRRAADHRETLAAADKVVRNRR